MESLPCVRGCVLPQLRALVSWSFSPLHWPLWICPRPHIGQKPPSPNNQNTPPQANNAHGPTREEEGESGLGVTDVTKYETYTYMLRGDAVLLGIQQKSRMKLTCFTCAHRGQFCSVSPSGGHITLWPLTVSRMPSDYRVLEGGSLREP